MDVVSDLPSFDTRPTNPLYAPLSLWLCGENPVEPWPFPETQAELAEKLDVEPNRLTKVRHSKGFRRYHQDRVGGIDELLIRRQEALDTLYANAMAGSVQAASAFLTATKDAAAQAKAGKIDPAAGMPAADMKDLTDEEVAALAEQAERKITALVGEPDPK